MKLYLAPMSNITNLPFRLMCKKYGADVVFSEMINADAIIYENKKTLKRAYFSDDERPIGVQLVGSDLLKLKKALKIVENMKPDFIDLNFGCPAYNVIKIGSGSAILKDLDFLEKLVKELSSSTKLPLTCKMRISAKDEKTIQAAKIIEKSGASVLTIHGRTVKQKYSGKANWDIIGKVKKELSIPVILNGDVIDGESAKKALETKCDGLMIGRASIGNPFVFREIKHYLKTGEVIKQDIKEKSEDFLEYVELCKKYDYLNISAIKMQAQYFTKGYSRKLRREISELKTIDDIHGFFEEFRKNI